LVSGVDASRSENNVLCLPAFPGKWLDDALPPIRMGLSGGSTQCLETGGGICCYICSNSSPFTINVATGKCCFVCGKSQLYSLALRPNT